MNQLEEIRRRLDACDDEIIAALARRMGCIQEIISCKRENGLPILQPEQEEKERRTLHQKLSGNEFLPEIEAIYTSIVESSKRIQAKSLFSHNIFLIGFMGCGKSSVSAYLSRMLAMQVAEMDAVLVARAGMPITEIFATYGEEYFRNMESNLIMELGRQAGTIISCGGGVPMREVNVRNMRKNGRVVLLTAAPETIYERVKDDTGRPILNGHMNVPYIAELMQKRRPIYEAAADITVSTDGRSLQQICEELIQKMCAMEETRT